MYTGEDITKDLKTIIDRIQFNMYGSFSSRIRSAMEAQGLNQSDLARRAGVSRQRIHQILTEKRKLNAKTVERIEKALGTKLR